MVFGFQKRIVEFHILKNTLYYSLSYVWQVIHVCIFVYLCICFFHISSHRASPSVGGQNNRLLKTLRRRPFQPFTPRPLISMSNASHIRVLCVSIILSFPMSTPEINIDMRGDGGRASTRVTNVSIILSSDSTPVCLLCTASQ